MAGLPPGPSCDDESGSKGHLNFKKIHCGNLPFNGFVFDGKGPPKKSWTQKGRGR